MRARDKEELPQARKSAFYLCACEWGRERDDCVMLVEMFPVLYLSRVSASRACVTFSLVCASMETTTLLTGVAVHPPTWWWRRTEALAGPWPWQRSAGLRHTEQLSGSLNYESTAITYAVPRRGGEQRGNYWTHSSRRWTTDCERLNISWESQREKVMEKMRLKEVSPNTSITPASYTHGMRT